MFSVILPSWNSLEYLKVLHGSLKKNTKVKYELIVHDNGSTDDTLAWLKENNVKYSRSETNEGSAAINYAAKLAIYPYLIVANSDHYFLPGWDTETLKRINAFKQNKIDKFFISFCVIEPVGNNPECVIHYCGHDTKTFNEQELLRFYLQECSKYDKIDTNQYSGPNCIPKKLWDEFGGMDMDYYPGWASDHDFAARAYRCGCRDFLLMGKAKAFHFSSKTFQKLPKEVRDKHGHDIFLKKWGLTVEEFRDRFKIKEPYEHLKDGLLEK
jgi:GT2 family glycosyltransferase